MLGTFRAIAAPHVISSTVFIAPPADSLGVRWQYRKLFSHDAPLGHAGSPPWANDHECNDIQPASRPSPYTPVPHSHDVPAAPDGLTGRHIEPVEFPLVAFHHKGLWQPDRDEVKRFHLSSLMESILTKVHGFSSYFSYS
jgi:hypothetical protein